MKVFDEGVFCKLDKVETLKMLDNLRKSLYSEIETERDISFNLFELIDDISLLLSHKPNCDDSDPISIREENKNKENGRISKSNELRNSILSILVELSIIVFSAQFFPVHITIFPNFVRTSY